MFVEIAIAILGTSAAADGVSTNYAIQKGAVEVDPIMLTAFGTNKPGLKEIFLKGGAIVSAEAIAALVISHFHPVAGLVVASLLLVQACVHTWATFHNLKQT